MIKITDVVVEQGLSAGAIYAVAQIAKRLGIEKVLGKTQEGKLALWQVITRVLEQGSRQPNEICSELLEALQIKLPDTLEKNQSIVHTYKELSCKI